MTELSPAAQAVLDAVEDDCIHPTDLHRIAAAALRAAAELPYSVPVDIRGDDYWYYRKGVESERELNLAIADELDPP